MSPIQFIALDRDGTVIENKHYLSDPEGVEFTPGAIEGLRSLSALGLPLVLVTNQSGIGRGYFNEADMHAVHERMLDELRQADIRFTEIYFCPHTPDDDCLCRKPATGMLEAAAARLKLPLSGAVVVGDNACDIELGRAANARTILVRTGHGRDQEPEVRAHADAVVDDLRGAADQIAAWLGENA